MSAVDTFEWYVSSNLSSGSAEVQNYVREHRDYLLTLRSEDERQRYVAAMIEEVSRGIPAQKSP